MCACLACPLVFDSFVSCRVCGLSVGCDCGCCCGLAWCRVQCSLLAVALCCPSCLLQRLCSGPVQLCLLSVWPRSHWSVAVTGWPHLAQVCVSPVASRASHALRRWRCAASYPLAVELPRCRSYAWAWMAQKRVPCLTSCGQLCQAHRRRLTVESSSLWWCVVLRAGVGPAWVECVVVIMVMCAVWRHGWLGSDRWYLRCSARSDR